VAPFVEKTPVIHKRGQTAGWQSSGAPTLLAMLISAREAADLLAPLGIGRESTRRVLAFGLAGPAHETRSARLYDRDRVAALLGWPPVDLTGLDETVRAGVFVARLGNHVGTLAEAARGPWRISPWLRTRISMTQERQGFVPLVATIGGFVVLGADITGGVLHAPGAATIGRQPGRTCTFTLTEPRTQPRPWFDDFEGHRLPTGPGAAWRWWQPPNREHPPARN
jgi:hypothetical protein